MVQLKLGEDPEVKREELRQEKIEEEIRRKERAATEAEFNKHFKGGSTNVIRHEGYFYFWGDVSHCGRDSIFHNAREIRNRMKQNNNNYGHMNYNDLPTFEVSVNWDDNEIERKRYEDDLYIFDGDNIKVMDKVFETEQIQKYCLDKKKE